MELIVIGAGPAYTSRRGAAGSSYLLRSGSDALLLDLGHGAFSNLASELEPSSLEGILVSHLHPDHFVDLVPLRHYLKWEFDPPRRATVLGPAGLADRLDALDGNPDFAAAALDINELSEGVQRFGPFEVEARRVAHTAESYAFRVSATGGSGSTGGSGADSDTCAGLVYSGDCSRAEDLLALIRPGDTLLSEASFGAGPIAAGAQHITSGDAGRIATTGGAARLLITHVLAGHSRDENLAAARAEFTGPVQLVTEGDRFEV
ncbi:MAG TPA: MBL fold metallo-hydrolase [Candidatus Limnocylindrales bacterium]